MSVAVRKIKGYGWRKDMPDPRDRIFNLENRVDLPTAVPREIDLEPQFPAAYDQAQLGSCTGNGWAALMEYRAMQQNKAFGTPSRLFIYAKEREREGTPLSQDSGAEVRSGAWVVANLGVPPETEWPYSDADPGPYQQEPPANVVQDATQHEALAYKRIVLGGPGAPMRSALAQGYPIVFGFPVPDYFEQGWDPATQPLPVPTKTTQFIGGHCMVVVGYDFTETQFRVPVFKVRNSWGTSWGSAGYCWFDYRWFPADNSLGSDLWVITQET